MTQINPDLLADLLRESLKEGKLPFLTVISNSMSPLIRRGDQIRLGPTSAENLRPGDIVVFHNKPNLITHRFWGYYNQNSQRCLVTKGDRPQQFDQPFSGPDLVGLVIGRRRNQRLLNLSAGPGHWLNKHLATLAKLEIHLFSKPLSLPAQAEVKLPSASGRLAISPTNWLMRLIRRLIYSWAIILTAFVSGTSSTLIEDIEE